MSLSDTVIPIVTVVIGLGFGLWFSYLLLIGIKKVFPNIDLWMRYSVFKGNINPEWIEFCGEYMDLNKSWIEMEKTLLKLGWSVKKVREITYIYEKLKGGID